MWTSQKGQKSFNTDTEDSAFAKYNNELLDLHRFK